MTEENKEINNLSDLSKLSENEENQYPEKILKLPNIWNAHCGYDLNRKFNFKQQLTHFQSV